MTVAPNGRTLEDTVAELAISALGNGKANLKPNEPLLSMHSGFDSFSLLELVMDLEDTFNISIPDEDLDADIFYSIETVSTYVNSRVQQGL
jgi:acyl carrier protein